MELKIKFLNNFGRILGLFTIVNWLIWLLLYVVGILANQVALVDIVPYFGLLVGFLFLIWPRGFDYRNNHWRNRLLLAVAGAYLICLLIFSGLGPRSIIASRAMVLYLFLQIVGLSTLPLYYRRFDRQTNPPLEDLSLIPLIPISPFTIQWLVATSLGVGIGLAAAILFVLSTEIFLFFSIGGLFLGFSQWLVLRCKLKNSGLWILATFCAWVLVDICFWVGILMPYKEILVTIALVSTILFQVFAGFLIGSAQWIILRKQFSDSRKWILYSTGAWCIGALVSFPSFPVLVGLWGGLGIFPGIFLTGIIIGIFHGIPYGLITGISMERIMKTPILGEENLNRGKSLN